MITPSYAITATERVLPKLALDFTTASLDPRVTFTRATDATHPATYTNNSGYIASSTNNAPRFDYDPTTLTCNGLLIEESRTNYAKYSNTLTNGAWSQHLVSLAANAITSPNGTTDSITMTATSTSNSGCYVWQTGMVTTSADLTATIYAKKGSGGYVGIEIYDGTNDGLYGFNLNTGAVGASAILQTGFTTLTASIKNVGNGWYRCSLYAKRSGTGNVSLYIYGACDSTATYACTLNDYNYVCNAQLEAGAFATSYIPTTVLSLTRNADEASMSGTNFTDWWNSTANTIEFQYQTTLSGSATGNRYIGCVAKDATNFIEICGKSTAAKTIVYQSIAGSFDVSLTGATSIFTNTYNKLIVAMQANNYGFALNSTSQGTDTSCALLSSPTSFEIGRWKEGASYGGYFCGWVQKINAYPQRLTASELSAFTAG